MYKTITQSNGSFIIGLALIGNFELIISAVAGIIVLFILLKRKRKSQQVIIANKAGEEKFQIKQIIESETTYEADGNETRIIDNSKGNGMVRRKLTVSKEWSKTISYSNQDKTSKNMSAGVAINFLEIKSHISKTIQEKYEVSDSDTRSFSEEIEIEVMPYSKIKLNIEWKKIWQSGMVELETKVGSLIEVPFKVSKGITFDQTQEKMN